jgi:hypothetical protein
MRYLCGPRGGAFFQALAERRATPAGRVYGGAGVRHPHTFARPQEAPTLETSTSPVLGMHLDVSALGTSAIVRSRRREGAPPDRKKMRTEIRPAAGGRAARGILSALQRRHTATLPTTSGHVRLEGHRSSVGDLSASYLFGSALGGPSCSVEQEDESAGHTPILARRSRTHVAASCSSGRTTDGEVAAAGSAKRPRLRRRQVSKGARARASCPWARFARDVQRPVRPLARAKARRCSRARWRATARVPLRRRVRVARNRTRGAAPQLCCTCAAASRRSDPTTGHGATSSRTGTNMRTSVRAAYALKRSMRASSVLALLAVVCRKQHLSAAPQHAACCCPLLSSRT